MSSGPKDRLPSFAGRKPYGLARISDLQRLTGILADMPMRPGRGIRFRNGPNGTIIDAAAGGSAAPKRKWGIIPDGDSGDYDLNPGRLWDGNDEVTVTLHASVQGFTPSAGKVIYLEYDGSLPTTGSSWSVNAKFGTLPDSRIYEAESGVFSLYRKILVDFTSTDPGSTGLQLGASLWAEWRTGDADLQVIVTAAEAYDTIDTADVVVTAMEFVGT